jgi:PAS domain S-box-containing protein
MSFILMLAISAVPLTLGITMICLFEKNRLTFALFIYMLLICSWQIDMSVLFSERFFQVKTIDFLFRLFRFGTIMQAPALLYIAYVALNDLTLPHIRKSIWSRLMSKHLIVFFNLWSLFVYAVNWSHKGIVNLYSIHTMNTTILYPLYGEWNWAFKLHLMAFAVIIGISFIISIKIYNSIIRTFLILFITAMAITYGVGILNLSKNIIVISSGISVMIHSLAIFVAFIRMQALTIRKINVSLKEQKDFLRQIIDMSPTFIYAKNLDGDITLANVTFASAYGTTVKDLVGKKEEDFCLNKEMTERLFDEKLVILFNKTISKSEESFIDSQGRTRWLQSIKIPFHTSTGKQMLCVATDITTRKVAEEALKEAESKYRSLVEKAPVGVYIIQEARFVYVNPRMSEIFGYTVEELLNMEIKNLFVTEDRPLIEKNISKQLNNHLSSISYQARGIKKDQSLIYLEIHGSTTTYEGKPAIIGMYLDITERVKTEEIIRKSDKLSVVGELAAGVAHEIRNPLTSLKGFLQLLQSKTNDNKIYFDIMLSELDRINFIVNEFLVLAKPQIINFQKKDLLKILQNITILLNTQAIINNVQINVDFDPSIPLIECEENLIKQLFINILKNAIEAMADGGEIKVQAMKYQNDRILIRCIDQGCGIPEERQIKLFEPFYTTKEKGTGLGLMVCYKIIEAHNGKITIESKINEGTTVNIILPIKHH